MRLRQEASALAQITAMSDAVAAASDRGAQLRLAAIAARGRSLLYDALVPQVPIACVCAHVLVSAAAVATVVAATLTPPT